MGFVVEETSPCRFYREGDDVSCVGHGDDFTFEGPPDALKAIAEEMRQFWIVKVRAALGPEPADDKEVSILNRVVRWSKDGLPYEVDPRHVEKLLREADMEDCKSLSTPGVKEATSTSEPAWLEQQLEEDDEDLHES